MRRKKLRIGEWDRRWALGLGCALVALCLLLCGDRLAASYFSPGGVFLRALPAAVERDEEERPRPDDTEQQVEFQILEHLMRSDMLIKALNALQEHLSNTHQPGQGASCRGGRKPCGG